MKISGILFLMDIGLYPDNSIPAERANVSPWQNGIRSRCNLFPVKFHKFVSMNKIPTHKISEVFDGDNAFILRVGNSDASPAHRERYSQAEYAHRDDYYIFFYIKKGDGKVMIDFETYEFGANTVHCIMPGQVHQPVGDINVAEGWFLAVDSLLVKSGYKEIFERKSLAGVLARPSRKETAELDVCLSVIEQRFSHNKQSIERSVLSDLISSFIGMVADIYQKGIPTSFNNRAVEITLQFKLLLSENYPTMKRPAQYANRMNLSLVYLNEVVKKTTGLSVSHCIRDEIVLQAKRLLYYTSLNVKEISLKLGYEDWAYFTRLFTKAAGCPPSQFRNKNLD